MKTALKSKATAYIIAGIVAFVWASAFPAVRYVLQYYTPEAIMLFRFIVASLVLLGYCAWKKIPPPKKKDFPMFFLGGFVGLFLYMWAFITGTSFVSAGISSFIIASAPIFTLILSILFLKEKASVLIWIGVLVGFGGIAIISFTQAEGLQLNIGVLILLVASCLTSVFMIVQKHLLRTYTAIQCSAYSVGIATVFMCIFLPALIREFPHAPMSANLVIVYLGAFPAGMAYFLWNLALSKVEKTIYVTSFLYLIPFIASILAFLWLGEEMPALALLGGIVIIVGMVITNFMQKKSVAPAESKGDSV